MTLALIDFFGPRPRLTLMNARARTVTFAPFVVPTFTRRVCLNGALRSIFVLMPVPEKSTRVTLTKRLPFRLIFANFSVTVNVPPAGTHARGVPRLSLAPPAVAVVVLTVETGLAG